MERSGNSYHQVDHIFDLRIYNIMNIYYNSFKIFMEHRLKYKRISMTVTANCLFHDNANTYIVFKSYIILF